MRRCSLVLISFALCAIPVLGQASPAAGTWDATLTSPQGSFNIQLILKQDGD